MAANPSADEVDAIIADPDWLPYQVRDEGRTLKFINLPPDKVRELSFFDNRVQGGRWERVSGDAPRTNLALEAVAGSTRPMDSGPCHYIFHSAFCCSTLMSRALDVKGVARVLREPRVLHDIGQKMPHSNWPAEKEMLLNVVLDLLKRPQVAGEATIIKPANIVNPMIDYIMEHQPNSRALLMYGSLPSFLLAIARERRWMFGRGLAAFYRDHLEFQTERTRDLLYLTDLQMAAFLWLQQQAQFARLVRDLPGRVATLRADAFVQRPAEAVAAAAALFDLSLDEKEAAEIAAGPLFQNHSKRPSESFDEASRKHKEALVKMAFGPEIEQAVEWGEALAAEVSVPLDLPGALIS